MRELEAADYNKQLSEKDLVLAKKDVVIAKLQAEVHKARIEKLEAKAADDQNKVVSAHLKYDEVTKSLRAKNKVGVNWGYDPLSGEIKE
jgi:hypothetical protein